MQQYIKEVYIKGFKKFRNFNAKLNNDLNIIIGDNESGKSSFLEAINITINQIYKNTDKSYLEDLFNKEDIEVFNANPDLTTLPKIIINIVIDIEDVPKNIDYFGANHSLISGSKEMYGIEFKCELEKQTAIDLTTEIKSGKIPFEYYTLSWNGFSGEPYQTRKKPLNYVFIDSSENKTNVYDYYAKNLFQSKYNNGNEIPYKFNFNNGVKDAFDRLSLLEIEPNRKFGLNSKKIILENLLGILDNDILLENKGKGKENLIKTEIALGKHINSDVISIEEPENHLSHINLRQMIENIDNNKDGKQIIITTHNNLIVTRFNLKKVLWINETNNTLNSLDNICDTVKDYFIKLENNNLLQFILSPRVILVEGPTEYLMIDYIYKQIYSESIEKSCIDIISCNGLTYKNYIEVAKLINKKVAVITDNDGDQSKINEINTDNAANQNINIFTAQSIDLFTWEKCLLEKNKTVEEFMKLITLQEGAHYKIGGKEPETKELGYMMNHKVKFAMDIINSGIKLEIPDYVKEALKWIKK